MKTIGIVSLSLGMLGEAFAAHEVEIGMKRLQEYGLNIKIMPNAEKGISFLSAHPEKRAEDLLQAFRDPEIDMIITDIGGDNSAHQATSGTFGTCLVDFFLCISMTSTASYMYLRFLICDLGGAVYVIKLKFRIEQLCQIFGRETDTDIQRIPPHISTKLYAHAVTLGIALTVGEV